MSDLLWWGCQLVVLSIGLAIVWTKIDSTNKAMASLLKSQIDETELVKRQLRVAEEQTTLLKNNEDARTALLNATQKELRTTIDSIHEIQIDINTTLNHIQSINQAMLTLANQSKTAAEQAEGAANKAADTSAATNESVKKMPKRNTTVIHRKVQRIQKVQKVYKLF